MKYLVLAILFLSFAVGAQHSHHSNEKMSVKRQALAEKELSEAKLILNKNDELFNAFLKKDGALVEKKASELSQLAKKIIGPNLKNVKAQASQLDLIKASNDQDKNLVYYEAFVNPLIKFIQTYDVGDKFNVFSCPMVKKSWIQNTDVNKDVRNVYAMYMLECGTQDTKF